MNLTIKLILTVFILIAFKINAAEFKNKDNPTVQEVVEKSSESETPRQSDTQTAEDLAMEFLDEVGLTEGENGDLFATIKPKEISKFFIDNFKETIHPSQLDLKKERIKI